MNVFAAFMIFLTSWYYIPLESPTNPVEINRINLNLKNKELAMSFFSLSDGEAALIQHPDGENILINTGGTKTESELKNLLELYQVSKIAAIILTSEENCCVQNLKWLIEEYDVKKVIAGEHTINTLKIEGNNLFEMEFELWSKGMLQEPLPETAFEVLNDKTGLDLSIRFLNKRVVWLNSPSTEAEEFLLKPEFKDTNIFKLSSFEINEENASELLKHLDPQIAILYFNKDVQPNTDLLESLNHAWVNFFYSKNQVTATVKFTEKNYEVFKISNKEK